VNLTPFLCVEGRGGR